MTNSCRLIDTEYSRNFIKRKHKPVKIIIPRDYFAERIREGEIDPRVASIPTKLDEAAEQLIHKHILDYAQTVYQVTYKNPWAPQDERTAEDLGSELIAYIHGLYFDPHDEKVLAPPVTTKRLFGYIRPKFLHETLSTYQDTVGRTGATIMLQEQDKKETTPEKIDTKKFDFCDIGNENTKD